MLSFSGAGIIIIQDIVNEEIQWIRIDGRLS